MDSLTAVFNALSDRNRFRVFVALLSHEELCACQIVELLRVAGATVSRHMGILISSGLVASRKDGRWVHYRLRREVDGHAPLFEWIACQIKDDPGGAEDAAALRVITAREPEGLCRRQRGDV